MNAALQERQIKCYCAKKFFSWKIAQFLFPKTSFFLSFLISCLNSCKKWAFPDFDNPLRWRKKIGKPILPQNVFPTLPNFIFKTVHCDVWQISHWHHSTHVIFATSKLHMSTEHLTQATIKSREKQLSGRIFGSPKSCHMKSVSRLNRPSLYVLKPNSKKSLFFSFLLPWRPRWEDFLLSSLCEIRLFSANEQRSYCIYFRS